MAPYSIVLNTNIRMKYKSYKSKILLNDNNLMLTDKARVVNAKLLLKHECDTD